MVNNANKRGFFDWLVQRVTAVVIGAYAIFMLAYLLNNRPLYFAQWHTLFACLWMKVATFIVLLSVLWHAWVGLWTVFTDYVKCGYLRLFLEILVVILFLGYLAVGIDILWG